MNEDIFSLALQLQELKRSPGWKEIRRITLHIRPSDGRINKLRIIQSEMKTIPRLETVGAGTGKR